MTAHATALVQLRRACDEAEDALRTAIEVDERHQHEGDSGGGACCIAMHKAIAEATVAYDGASAAFEREMELQRRVDRRLMILTRQLGANDDAGR